MEQGSGEVTVTPLARGPVAAPVEHAIRARLVDVVVHPAVVPLVVAALTAATFAGTLWNGFVDWDDTKLLVKNEAYRGLGWTQISWMFSNVMMGHYVPITWLTHGLDYVLWGMRPAGYHLTNLLLHATNAALFALVALRLLDAAARFTAPVRRLAAAAAALFFALHPLRTESVAWVTERRDVLSGAFLLVTLLLYLRSHGEPGAPGGAFPDAVAPRVDRLSSSARYWTYQALAWVAYLLAILSKSIVMTLPVILVLLDFYPLRRLGPDWRAWGRPPAWLVWREKIPYTALAALAAMLGYYAQEANGFFTSPDIVPWTARPSLVLYSFWFYVEKTVLPLRLAPLYELPASIDPLAFRFLVPAAVIVLATTILVAFRRRWPAGLATWLSYTILLAPVAGLTHSGYQLAHDRYSYLSCLPWALLLGAGVGALLRAGTGGALRPIIVKAGVLAFAAWLAGLSVLTWQQVETWRDTDSLWLNAAEAEPACALCRYNVGARAFNSGLHSIARDQFQRLLQFRPDRVQIHGHLGLAHVALGEIEQAIAAYRRVLARDPNDAETHNNLGVALQILGRRREALAEMEYALRLAPDNEMVRTNIAILYAQLGQPAQAMPHLTRALELKPDLARARFELASLLLAAGRVEAARDHYERLQQDDGALASILGPAFLATW
ncbi:MAG: tetratricopeptide repeat protein [Candidatus Rokubacteria bacterium]|nr:tetratricopeptide repeat protein [Candidatus Rokubacteria bacterium]